MRAATGDPLAGGHPAQRRHPIRRACHRRGSSVLVSRCRATDSHAGQQEGSEPITTVRVLPATAETWPQLGRVFGPRENYPTSCWCQRFRRHGEPPNRDALQREIHQADPPVGLLAYLHGDVVGWTRAVPRSTLHGIAEHRARSSTCECVGCGDDRRWCDATSAGSVGAHLRGLPVRLRLRGPGDTQPGRSECQFQLDLVPQRNLMRADRRNLRLQRFSAHIHRTRSQLREPEPPPLVEAERIHIVVCRDHPQPLATGLACRPHHGFDERCPAPAN